jgi:pyruvate dehydrogenase E2 component (dihydrolipoamide acetyltransferase)
VAEAILMLALSPTMEEGTITRWHKKEGDPVASGDLLCEVETDKATMEYESVNQGTLLAILVSDGGRARVGAPIAVVGKPGEDASAFLHPEDRAMALPPASAPAMHPEDRAAAQPEARTAAPGAVVPPPGGGATLAAAAPPSSFPPSGARRLKASPLARRLARERNLDLARIGGSGPGGRVVKRDLEQAAVLTGMPPEGARPASGPRGGAVGPAASSREP